MNGAVVRTGALLLLLGVPAAAQVPGGSPLAVIDLTTESGLGIVSGEWRYSDVTLEPVPFWQAGPDGQPGGVPSRAHDIRPHAGAADFDDSGWERIEPGALSRRRTAGGVSFAWYRLRLTVPDRVDELDPSGLTAVLEISVDDYAEIWVDGELPRPFGGSGESVVAGWNRPNRLVVGRNVQPGQTIRIAVFGINGPISAFPTNYVYVRSARLELFPGGWEPHAVVPQEVNVDVVRLDPAVDRIVPRNPKLFKLAEGFTFTEGPVWVDRDGGYLLFSDPNENRIYRYTRDGRLSVFRANSGYAGADAARYRQPGSNGLSLDVAGRLTVCEHGNRRVSRIEDDGAVTVLADRYGGARLNSPNDLVYRADGSLYFTDPPFGRPGFFDDPDRDTPYSGVYCLREGRLRLLVDDLRGPNGIALSPDQRTLYVGNWDPERKVVMRYPVLEDGGVGPGEVLIDMTGAPQEEAIDGIKVDVEGNLYVSGPGGIWLVSPQGVHLGTIVAPHPAHNFAWGDAGSTLYVCARRTLYRMPLAIPGLRTWSRGEFKQAAAAPTGADAGRGRP